MTPAQFEASYAPQWDELDALLAQAERGRRWAWRRRASPWADASGPTVGKEAAGTPYERIAALYRATCEHLALSQARAYPIHIAERLEELTQRAHQLIYRQHDIGWPRLRRFLAHEVPQALRAEWRYIAVAGAAFVLPLLAMAMATWADPGAILMLMDASDAAQYERMYSPDDKAIGRLRGADDDWSMFGFYVRHNIGIGFQCFASGLLAGVGSLWYLVFNGLQIGGVAGFLTARGHGDVFFPFVASHSPFELTAIVFSGAAGLRLGHALLAPGRLRRIDALAAAAQACVPVIGAVFGMLLIAAALEAFWSSAPWVAPAAKYATSAFGGVLVTFYALRMGRGGSHVG